MSILLGQTEAIVCQIQLFTRDTQNWSNFFAGTLLGLHNSNTTDRSNCLECDQFGTQLGRINLGLVSIEETRQEWIDQTSITTSDIFKIAQTLVNIYVIFMYLFIPVDAVLSNAPVMDILT